MTSPGERPSDPGQHPAAWRRYLRFFGADPDSDVDDEIRTHIDLRIEDNLARGLSPEDARREAMERFGDLERVRAECRALGHERERSMRRTEMIATIGQDVRYAIRTLLRAPAFALVAILSLALGIGANTAIFGLVDSLVLRPLPGITEASTLVELEGSTHSYPAFRMLRDDLDIFADVAAYRTREMSVISGPGASPLIARVTIVSGNYFDVLGTRPALGRTFASDEDRPGARIPVAVLSHGYWTRAFGADSAVLGHAVRLNGVQFTVIGVAPAGFRGTRVAFAPEMWIPLEAAPLTFVGELATADMAKPGWGWLSGVGRLPAGTSPGAVQARLRAVGERQKAANSLLGWEFAEMELVPAADAAASMGDGPGGGAFALLLFGVVGLTVLIACTNVAGLLLARASRRRKEISVRLALGASRARLVRQLLTESLVLGLAGAIAGVLLAALVVPVLSSISVPGVGSIELMEGRITSRMLVFAILIGLASSVCFGLIPALQASRPALVDALKDLGAGARGGRARLRAALVVAQLALSLMLLAGAGLFLRSLRAAARFDTGYEIDRVAVAALNVGYRRFDPDRAERFYETLRERLATQPDIESTTWAISMPLIGDRESLIFRMRAADSDTLQRLALGVNGVGPDFFRTLGIPIARGRAFDTRDARGTPRVAVVNETMARRYWPDADAVGARILLGREEVTIIGVVRDARYASLDERPSPHVYLPTAQDPGRLTDNVVVFVRAADPGSAVAAIREQARALDAEVPVLVASPFQDVLGTVLLPQRVAAAAFAMFGALTLLLSAVGVYGIMAYTVAQRTREMGIRMALGATTRQVMTLVLQRSMVLIVVGAIVGLGLALAAARVTAGFLFGVGATDPWAFGGSVALLALSALIASVIPAHRATRIAPSLALRAD